MGIPAHWDTVDTWLNDNYKAPYPEVYIEELKERRFPNIRILEDYSQVPDNDFWSNFPYRDLPKKASTRINVRNFRNLINENRNSLTKMENKRADKVLSDLQQGADSYQRATLPPITVPNTKSAIEHGALMTDKIASWIEDGFVAGPFDSPPMPGFRANPLMAVIRNGKVRPVLNMSGPLGASFNDNVDETKLEKVHMDTARGFGFKLKEAGKKAKFSKFDYKDAYKTVPSKTEDYRLQGFKWLGKYFVETQQTFGGIPSVCNFDRESNTLKTLATVISQVPRDFVLRILDDTSNIGPENSAYTESFASAMKKICGFINMPMAPECPKREKAFTSVTRGVVMGIGFDSENLTWYMPKEKADRTITRCLDVANSIHVDLKQMEKVLGSINDLAQMAPFAKFYRHASGNLLKSFKGDYNILRPVSEAVKNEMLILAKISDSARSHLPIPSRPCPGPLSTLDFYTDAAGASYSMVNGLRYFHSNNQKGVSCIGGCSKDTIWRWTRLEWPVDFITAKLDNAGKHFGNKSTTLESIGLLLPFLSFPEEIAGRFIRFKVDNIAVVYGWENGHVKFDSYATEILKAVNVAACFLGVKIFIQHVPRMSDEMAEIADSLSRRRYDNRVPGRCFKSPSSWLSEWFEHPSTDGQLASLLLSKLKNTCLT